MGGHMGDKRGSERVIPMVTDEEMVVVGCGSRQFLAKMMDLSDTGTLTYMLDADADPKTGAQCVLSLWHQGNVFAIDAVVARRSGRLVGFQFLPGCENSPFLQVKLIRMEVEWNRLKSLV